MRGKPIAPRARLTFAHEILDMWVPGAGALRSASISSAVRRAAEAGGLTVLRVSAHDFKPEGFTIFALLSQSHVAIHTWPEIDYVACDVFSCSGELDKVVRELVDAIAPEAVYRRMITRGEPTESGSPTLFQDQTGPGIRTSYDVKLLARYDSEFQHAEVYRHRRLGKMLVINEDVQFAESDHALYDDALMAPLQEGAKNRTVLVIGGGDGLCATYLLSKRIASEVKVLELDPIIPAICKRHFPQLSAGLRDSRTCVQFGDAAETIGEERDDSYDAVIIDTTAPDTQRGRSTYDRHFLADVRRVLKPGGRLCMNGTSIWYTYSLASTDVEENVRRTFPNVTPTVQWIPSFASPWSFFHATKVPVQTREC